MPKSKFMQSSFVSGELSPLLKGRVDLDQYYQGMETAENVLIVPQGGLKRRAGTQHVDTAENILVPFIFSGLGQLFTFTVTTGLPIVGATYTNNSSTCRRPNSALAPLSLRNFFQFKFCWTSTSLLNSFCH